MEQDISLTTGNTKGNTEPNITLMMIFSASTYSVFSLRLDRMIKTILKDWLVSVDIRKKDGVCEVRESDIYYMLITSVITYAPAGNCTCRPPAEEASGGTGNTGHSVWVKMTKILYYKLAYFVNPLPF